MKVIGSGPVAAQALTDLTAKHGGEVMKLSKDQLSARCVSRGLNAAGNKPDLATRLGTPELLALMPPPPPPPPRHHHRSLSHHQPPTPRRLTLCQMVMRMSMALLGLSEGQ